MSLSSSKQPYPPGTGLHLNFTKWVQYALTSKEDYKEQALLELVKCQLARRPAVSARSICLLVGVYPKSERGALLYARDECSRTVLHLILMSSNPTAEIAKCILGLCPKKDHSRLFRPDLDGQTLLSLVANRPDTDELKKVILDANPAQPLARLT